MKRAAILAVLVLGVGCYPTTTRPPFLSLPSATVVEWELSTREATQELALALDADSIPVRRTENADGWLETGWFDAATLRPTTRRPLGVGIVRLRAWADPSSANHSTITIETVYRPLADPSRDGHSLDQVVPANHPVAIRVGLLLNRLTKKFGDPGEVAAPAVAPDTGAAKKKVTKPDSTPQPLGASHR
ncbi:MAG: hypothetical protein ABIZ70_04325 [Gemmatimonadales bacterium]